jgi:carboxypeptidase PM20D1
VAEQSYRFVPLRLAPEDLKRIHGTDERISIDGYLDVVRFFVQLLRNTAG